MKKLGTRKSIRKYKKKYTEKIREKIKKKYLAIWQIIRKNKKNIHKIFGKIREKSNARKNIVKISEKYPKNI